MKPLEFYYYLKSLVIDKNSKGIFHSLKNPKEVMKWVLTIFIVCLLFFNLSKYLKLFFFILIFIVYIWKRKVDGDYRYWYKQKIEKKG